MSLAALIGWDSGDRTGDGGDSNGDRTTSFHVEEKVLYVVKTFHFNLVRYGTHPQLIKMGIWLAALTGGDRRDGTGDGSEINGDRTTASHVVGNVYTY
jgi:hypothetical protein